MSTHEPLHVIATSEDIQDDVISFQYSWSLRVSQRLLENSDAVVLNVSPPFTTAFHGVQFTWALRLSDECVISSEIAPSARHVFVLLYYKDGPCTDVFVEEVRAVITDATSGGELFKDLHSHGKEYTKGSGWPINVDKARRSTFTEFVQRRIDTQLVVNVTIRLKSSLFSPLSYLPDVETSQRIERHCVQFVENVQKKALDIPNMDLLERGSKDNKFSVHRLVFLYGCDLVERECSSEDSASTERYLALVRSTMAHIYFTRILMKEVEFFDDFLCLLEGVIDAPIPPLRREMERFICREVMVRTGEGSDGDQDSIQLDFPWETTDAEFTKKMVLLAERFQLDVLKMVATGVLVDGIIGHSDPPKQLVSISHELKQLASEMKESSSTEVTPTGDELVDSVVEDIQSLTRRVRRVSLSHSPSVSSQGSSPGSTPAETESLSPVVEGRDFEAASRFKRVTIS